MIDHMYCFSFHYWVRKMKYILICPSTHATNPPIAFNFLLLCWIKGPNLLVTFCSGCKEEMKGTEENNDAKSASSFRDFSAILDGLADCVTCHGNCTQVGLLNSIEIFPSIHLISFSLRVFHGFIFIPVDCKATWLCFLTLFSVCICFQGRRYTQIKLNILIYEVVHSNLQLINLHNDQELLYLLIKASFAAFNTSPL